MNRTKLILIFIVLIILPIFSFSRLISQSDAEKVARNFYYDQTGVKQDIISFEEVLTKSIDQEVYYYIFNLTKEAGFVIVSAEDSYHPIIGYSPEGSFKEINMPDNIRWWMNGYVSQIEYLRNTRIEKSIEIDQEWSHYLSQKDKFIPTTGGKAVEPLVGGILWDQGSGWNDLCPEDESGPGGHVWAGCVATAMGIVMKYWNYPIHGTGSHSYYAPGYGTLSANFGEATYFWNSMENTQANLFSAHLIYHLGVSVDMSYSPDGSGAFSFNVDNALENYFQYHSDASYVEKSSYTQENWIQMLKDQIDAGRPVYYSGRNDDNEGHAFVCSGYTDTDLFHFNFGWSGSNNGYYSVDDVGSFHLGQAAVINVYPENSNSYPSTPSNFEANLNTSFLDNFIVDLTWSAPSNKEVANYILYRDMEEIALLSSETLNYSDEVTEAGNYNYSISAKYANNEESLSETDYVQGLFFINFVVQDESGNIILSNGVNCQVTFNGQTLPTGFGSVSFTNVPFGGDQLWQASADGYPSSSNVINVIENGSFTITLDGYNVDIETADHYLLNVYPNPVKDVLIIQFKNQIDYEYEILDITGRTLLSGTGYNSKTALNLASIKTGYYILRIQVGNEIISSSFIKK